jgi:hypothetical protein
MPGAKESSDKISWTGRVVAVQPRIRLLRSFDKRLLSAGRRPAQGSGSKVHYTEEDWIDDDATAHRGPDD